MKTKRKHNPKWKDNTRAERIQKRRQRLNQIAMAHGFASWSAYETAVLNGVASLTKRAVDVDYCDCKHDNFTKYREGVYLCGFCERPRH